MPIALGIDTGGTYTDAVLLDYQSGEVLGAAKALTTRHDLSIGIEEAMARVIREAGEVGLVSLSTTLATNALVEGKGAPVCALLIGYDEQTHADWVRELNTDRIVFLSGGHTTTGEEITALDERAVRSAIAQHAPHVAAFAISGYFAPRNPAHELAVKRLVQTMTGLPCTCGHELTHRLNALRRATTVALNASLIPLVCDLIAAVERSMARLGVRAPLMVVKGDGSLMSAEVAKERPIETILSGPAASVVGAQHLASSPHAIVVDMGGTTTDIALVRHGRPALNPRGATVGRWQTMVEAVDVQTVGLGGDSRVWLSEDRALQIGPRRVVPISLLSASYPGIIQRLEEQLHAGPEAEQGEFFIAVRGAWEPDGETPPFEKELQQRLLEGPLTLGDIHALMRYPQLYAKYLERLERQGIILRAGLTPTDAAHVLGLYTAWDPASARLAAELLARRLGWDVETLCRQVVERMASLIAREVVRKLVREALPEDDLPAADAWLLERALTPREEDPLACQLTLKPTLTAIGAPVGTYFPQVARLLNAHLEIPPHAEVANAIGAVVGSVVCRLHIPILPDEEGRLHVHLPDRTAQFADLERAVAYAEALGRQLALTQALRAGAESPQVTVSRQDDRAPVGQGGVDELWVRTVIEITATGRPRLGQPSVEGASASSAQGETP